MPAFIATLLTWLLREVVVKFSVLAGFMALMRFLLPFAAGLICGCSSASALQQALSAFPDFGQYMLNLMGFTYALPMIICAMVSRFLIRRLPFIG